jgi:small subunit ribosomal protein S21
MAKVYVRKDEDLDSALRRFKRQMNEDGILNKVKEHQYYMSPGEKRREAEKKRIIKLRKLARRSFRGR